MTEHTGPGGPGLGASGSPTAPGSAAEIVLHQERALLTLERVATERVRITKRIVTATRTIEVPVRLEQLVITHEPIGAQDAARLVGLDPSAGAPEEVVVVLHEEVPEVSLRVVATERVVVSRRTVTGEQTVTVELAAEAVAVSTVDASTADATP